MSKKQILKLLTYDREFISELIGSYGVIEAIGVLRGCFDVGLPAARIKDKTLKMMIWNVYQSIIKLDEISEATHKSLDQIMEVSRTTNDAATRTISRHIGAGSDDLISYVMS